MGEAEEHNREEFWEIPERNLGKILSNTYIAALITSRVLMSCVSLVTI